MKSFRYRHSFTLCLDALRETRLSLSSHVHLPKKDLVAPHHTTNGRTPLQEHLDRLADGTTGRASPLSRAAPLLVISVRNVLSNLRCGAAIRGLTDGFVTVEEEKDFHFGRPYHVLAYRGGRFWIEEAIPTPEMVAASDWMLSGVPVLWDGEDVIERLVTDASDHSHVLHLPRGKCPDATPESLAKWEELHAAFLGSLSEPRSVACSQIMAHAGGLQREDKYLHNILAVDDRGRLIQHVGVGLLEDLGGELRRRGATRAIMVDNSGSVCTIFYPEGIRGERIQLLAAPNHRPRGTAFLIAVLADSTFEVLG